MADESNIKILIFTTAFRPFIGGSEIAIEEITRRLPDIFFDIVTPRYDKSLPMLEEAGNIRLHRIGWGWRGDKFLFPWLGFRKGRGLLSKAIINETIHAYQASYAAGAAWLLKLFNPKTRFMLTLQEGKDLENQNFLIKFFRVLIIKKADVITVISNYLKNYARKINGKSKISVIPNGVDVDNFSRSFSYGELSSLRDNLGIKPYEKVIISVSRLVPKNGIDNLIEATRILNQKFPEPNFKLILIGDGQEKKKLELLVGANGLQGQAIFMGTASHAELPKYLKISDVFVRPSRSEGLGSAFLEAMASEVAVIGTSAGGIPDFLKNKNTGLISKIDDPENLAEKIYQLVSDKELKNKIVKNAKELVAEKYDWQKIADDFRKIYLNNP
jgi:glycosyltransferase involved in cell wall biosynthesis